MQQADQQYIVTPKVIYIKESMYKTITTYLDSTYRTSIRGVPLIWIWIIVLFCAQYKNTNKQAQHTALADINIWFYKEKVVMAREYCFHVRLVQCFKPWEDQKWIGWHPVGDIQKPFTTLPSLTTLISPFFIVLFAALHSTGWSQQNDRLYCKWNHNKSLWWFMLEKDVMLCVQ